MSRFVIRIASHLLHWITDRRCPACGRAEVRRSTRKNFFEAALLPFLLTRPFRCDRFYCLALRRRVSALSAKPTSDRPPTEFTVPVYEDGEDEERRLP
jgi:hypothetical protein